MIIQNGDSSLFRRAIHMTRTRRVTLRLGGGRKPKILLRVSHEKKRGGRRGGSLRDRDDQGEMNDSKPTARSHRNRKKEDRQSGHHQSREEEADRICLFSRPRCHERYHLNLEEVRLLSLAYQKISRGHHEPLRLRGHLRSHFCRQRFHDLVPFHSPSLDRISTMHCGERLQLL